MKTTKTFNIYFWLRKNANPKNGKVAIYVRINVEGKRADISVKRTIEEKHWNPSSNRVNAKVKNAGSLNQYLDFVHNRLLDCHRELLEENGLVTAQSIKQRYLGIDRPVSTLNELIRYHTDFEQLKLAPGTSKNYRATRRYLSRFIKEVKGADDIALATIDYAFVVGFENYLRNARPIRKCQPLNNNGIMKHMERFQKMCNVGARFGWVMVNPFQQYRLKFEDYDSDFLDPGELERFRTFPLRGDILNLVRDLFVFSCFTGLGYIEVKNLDPSSVVKGFDGEQWINVRRQKTKTPVKVPLLPEAWEILKKYSDGHKGQPEALLPVISNQAVNRKLKHIASEMGISKHLTYHVARHTFATTVTLMNDVPLETVSKLLGHTIMDDHEEFKVIHLNNANCVVNVHHVSTGGDTGTTVPIRDVLQKALLIKTHNLIAVHNHPSGNLKPSKADIAITKKLKKGMLLGGYQVIGPYHTVKGRLLLIVRPWGYLIPFYDPYDYIGFFCS